MAATPAGSMFPSGRGNSENEHPAAVAMPQFVLFLIKWQGTRLA
jgi:hypothetical protein